MLQHRLLEGIGQIEQVFINGDLERRVPHNVNASFNYVEGESLIMGIKGIAVSSARLHVGEPGAEHCCGHWAAATSWRIRACA